MFIQNDSLEELFSDGRCPRCVDVHHLLHYHVSDLYLRYVVNKIPGSQKLQSNQAILSNSQRSQNKLFFTAVQH